MTLTYRSIELLLKENLYGPSLDIWSVGCVFGEILLRQGDVVPNEKHSTLFMPLEQTKTGFKLQQKTKFTPVLL